MSRRAWLHAKQDVPVFDPATLNATSWFKSGSGVSPWVNAASAGISGTQEWVQDVTSPVFVTLGGISALTFGHSGSSGSSAKLRASAGSPLGASDIGTYVAIASYTVMGLIYVVSAPAAAANVYNDTTVLSGDARFGIRLINGKIGIFHYTGSFPTREENMSAGAWHFFCVRYDSGTGKWLIDVDTTPGTLTTVGGVAALGGVQAGLAKNSSYTTSTAEYAIREMITMKSAISDATRDSYYSYLKATYPAAGLP